MNCSAAAMDSERSPALMVVVMMRAGNAGLRGLSHSLLSTFLHASATLGALQASKMRLRGSGCGKFCIARRDDLGDYAIGNIEIKPCEETAWKPSWDERTLLVRGPR
jgi:hypothetical protein